MDFLRPYLSRIIGPIIIALLGWLTTKFGIIFDADTSTKITEGTVVFLIPIILAANGLIHKTLDKYINPGDAASSHLAANEKVEATQLKQ